MADIADVADVLIDKVAEVQIAKVVARLAPSGVIDCRDCGYEIPIKRREVMPSAVHCIDCQGVHDAKSKNYV